MTLLAVSAAVLLLLANGYFVAVEFALVGSRRDKLETFAEEGSRRATVALEGIRDLNLQLAGAQLGITVSSLVLGFVAEPAVAGIIEGLVERFAEIPERVLHLVGLVVALTIVSFLHMVIGEMVPKNLALAGPERSLLVLAPSYRLFVRLFRPVIKLLNVLANLGMRGLRIEPRDELTSAHTADELATMLAESRQEGLIEDFAHDLMTGVLDFEGRTVASVMVPREDIVAVDRTTDVGEIERLVVESGHSRLPVLDHDLDHVLGFVHAKSLLSLPPGSHGRPLPMRLVRRMLVVASDCTLEELLRSMRRARVHMALVTDDEGTTTGVVSLEDLLEELVGDILDESDRAGGAESRP